MLQLTLDNIWWMKKVYQIKSVPEYLDDECYMFIYELYVDWKPIQEVTKSDYSLKERLENRTWDITLLN